VDGLYRSPALTALGLVAAFTPAALGSMGGPVLPRSEQRANRTAVARRLGFPGMVRVKQVHGSRVVYAPFARAGTVAPGAADISSEEPWPEADALWTDRAGVLLGVSAADCVPLLIGDSVGRIGAAHAGWHGTSERVAQALVRELVAAGAEPARLVAALGPAIGPCCYTIAEERAALIRERLGDGPWLRAVSPEGEAPWPRGGSSAGGGPAAGDPGREATWSFDVPGANVAQLREAGIRTIEQSGMCTRCHGADLWSHRSRGERGPQGTGVALVGRL